MALTLSGSTDTGYGVAGDTNGVRVNINNVTKATFDASGRLLVGLSSSLVSNGMAQIGGNADTRLVLDASSTQGLYFTKSSADNGTLRVNSSGDFQLYPKGASNPALTLDALNNLMLDAVTTSSGAKIINFSAASTGSNTTVNGQNYAVTVTGAKLFTVYLSNGDAALVFANYVSSTITIVAGGIAIVTSSTPGAGQFGIWKDPNSHVINFKTGSNLSATAAAWVVVALGGIGTV